MLRSYFETKSNFRWHAAVQLVEALRYKPEGRRFDYRWRHSGRTI